jgi:hypothetical protein
MVHHLGHHQTYLKTVNAALETLRGNPTTKHLAKMGIDRLLQNLDLVPEDLRPLVRNGGAMPMRWGGCISCLCDDRADAWGVLAVFCIGYRIQNGFRSVSC